MAEAPGPDAAFAGDWAADWTGDWTGGWIWEENLRPFCESVAEFSGHRFDDSDWQAIENALPDTDVERPGGWYDYPLSGPVPLTLLVADDPGSSVVFVRLTGEPDDDTGARIDAALHIFSIYRTR